MGKWLCVVMVAGVVACTGGDGDDTDTIVLEVVSGPPTIASFTPGSGTQQTLVVINGTNFVAGATVTFGGVVATQVPFLSAQKIKAVVPAGAPTGVIAVTTPYGTATSATTFKVKPLVGTFSPTGGLPGTVVTIHGSGFSGATLVKVGGSPMTFTFVDDATITATVPTGITTGGKITVTTPQGSDQSDAAFTLYPLIAGISPTEGLIGSSVTITGGGLSTVTVVKLGGKSMPFVHVDDSTLTATVPAGSVTAKITVTTPYGTRTSAATYTVIKAPALTSFTPGTAILPATVTLAGTNLSGTTNVSIAGYPLTTFTVSANKITVTVPIGAPNGPFTVVNPAGSSTSGASFIGVLDHCAGVTCVASDQCHAAGVCDPFTGACSDPALADGTTCSDGDACTQTDVCESGVCTASNPVVCADPEPCHDPGTCNPSTGACEYTVQADGTSCSEDACTLAGTCSFGTCVESLTCDVPITDGLIANWNAEFDATDDAGDHDGVFNGSWNPSYEGQAFHGGSGYVEVADADDLDFGIGDMTVTFWVKLYDLNDGNGMVHKDSWDGTSGRGWLFNIDRANGGVGFMTRDLDVGIVTNARIDPGELAANTWYHLAGVRSGNVLTFYVDGIARASQAESLATDLTNDIPLRIASLSPAAPEYLDGDIDDIRVYDHALSADEIAALHTCVPGYCVPNSSCADVLAAGNANGDGYYYVNLPGYTGSQFSVYCDMTTDGGGWTLGVNITSDFGPINLASIGTFYYTDRSTITDYRLTCSDSVYGASRKMFVTGVNPNDVNAWRAAGIVDKTNLKCSLSPDFSNPLFGGSCFDADTDIHTYWGNPAWDMAWALYSAGPAYTLRHCVDSGSGWWNAGKLWYR